MHKENSISNTERKARAKQAQKKYRADKRRVEIWMPNTKFARKEKLAQAHHLSVSKYVLKTSDKYEACSFLVPNLKALQAMRIEVRRVGNNVNNLTRLAYTTNRVLVDDFLKVSEQIQQMEEAVRKAVSEPDMIFSPKMLADATD